MEELWSYCCYVLSTVMMTCSTCPLTDLCLCVCVCVRVVHGLGQPTGWVGLRFLYFCWVGLGWGWSWVRKGTSPKIKKIHSLNSSTLMAMGLVGLWVGLGPGSKFSVRRGPRGLGWIGHLVGWVEEIGPTDNSGLCVYLCVSRLACLGWHISV